MHLSRILDQIKRHPSPTEALTKLGKAMDKHEDNLLEKGFRILKSELCANVYEAINGPHFDEEHAKYAVECMENEDGSKGPHWTVEETTSIANQIGINLKSEKHKQTQNIVNQIKPCPVPAYLTCNPYGCNGGFTGYGYGYGYGDSCCA